MRSWIPYGRQAIDDADVDAVVDVLRGDWLTCGPAVERFERALAERAGARFAVALNSGTAALHAAYAAAGVRAGDEVVTTPLTFAATANAALYLGATPVFADVQSDTGNIDPAAVRRAVTPRTRVIAPVDFAGHPAEMDEIVGIARECGARVVEDAAHSVGARYRGRPVGSVADMTTFSFHPVKHVTTAEGGAVTTDDEALYEHLREFRAHGITRDPAKLRRADGPWYHEMQSLGYMYRLSDVQCALGTSQLTKLDRFVARRREIVARYNAAFAGDPRFILPAQRGDVDAAWHLYVLRLADASLRRPLFEYLHREGIGVQVHYLPVYRHPYYEDLGYPAGLCPVAEDYYARCMSLPLFPELTDDEVDRVVATVREAPVFRRAQPLSEVEA